MINKIIGTLALTLLFAGAANAASLSIIGPDDVMVGDTLVLEIWGDFSGEGLIAGGITFLYDGSLVSLDDITLNLDVIADFSCPGSVNCPPGDANSAPIVWGEFLADLITPADPPALMATLTFTVIDTATEGAAVFSMIDNPALTGGWFGSGFDTIPTPTFGDKTVNVNAIPLPAAVWFMIGGLGTLLGFRRS